MLQLCLEFLLPSFNYINFVLALIGGVGSEYFSILPLKLGFVSAEDLYQSCSGDLSHRKTT